MKEFQFYFTNVDKKDVAVLKRLLLGTGCETKFVENEPIEGEMGFEEILIVLISSQIIPVALSVLGIWLKNRKIEFTIKNKNKELKIKLSNGQNLEKDLELIKNFLNENCD